MPDVHEASQTPTREPNGNLEMERLSALVKQLQADCDELRQALARSEAERNHYLKAI
jgi:hypothetical protein